MRQNRLLCPENLAKKKKQRQEKLPSQYCEVFMNTEFKCNWKAQFYAMYDVSILYAKQRRTTMRT